MAQNIFYIGNRRIFVFTASRAEAQEHFRNTVENTIPVELLQKFVPAHAQKYIEETNNAVHAWGAVPGPNNVSFWKKMQEGDFVIPYQKKRLKGLYRIIGKTHNEKFAEVLWGRGKNPDNLGKTWEYMYFLEFLAKFDIPSPLLFRGHSGPLSEKIGEKIWNSIPKNIRDNLLADEEKTYEELEEEIEHRINKGDYRVEDSWSKTKQRIGQNIFRKMVLENFGNKCCICGLDIPDLLEAAHIRPWAEDKDNRLNPRNGLSLCRLHHLTIEKDLMHIEKDGTIIVDPGVRKNNNKAVQEFISKYHKKTILQPLRYKPLLLE